MLDCPPRPVKVVICYIAVTNGPLTEDLAARFVTTYHEYPPGADHEMMVICQGGLLPTNITLLFEGLHAAMWPHPNTPGWDIDAHMDAAKGPCKDADIMICLGESVYFHRAGWLQRFLDAWKKYGPGFYGPFASNNVRGHLQTTAFCCHPTMLARYPFKVVTRKDRYEFEHGENALWRRLAARGAPVRLVTWDGEWEPLAWRFPNNIIYRGDQSNCLLWCNHSQGFADADRTRKINWSKTADQPFR